ncbi:MAG: VWA domain-containing protein [Caldilineaceae bacterium]|nr:VWA domain-containing protein [Caldilineaceae bacterium]
MSRLRPQGDLLWRTGNLRLRRAVGIAFWLVLMLALSATQAGVGTGALYAQHSDNTPLTSTGEEAVTEVLLTEDFENKTTEILACTTPEILPGWTGEYVKGYCWGVLTPNAWNNSGGSNGYLSNGSGPLPTENSIATPPMDFTNASAATLTLNMARIAVCTPTSGTNCSKATIEVKAANEQNWTVIKTYEKETIPGGLYTIPLTAQVAGKAGVQIRFTWVTGAAYDGYWNLDNIRVEATAPPPAPTNLTATPAGDVINLAWQAVTGANGYTVQDAPSANGPWSDLSTVTETNVVASGYACGTTRHFRVRSLNASGASAPSAVVSGSTSACASGLLLEEHFDGGIPATWSTQNVQSPASMAWRAEDVTGNNEAGGTGKFVKGGEARRSYANMNYATLCTPAINLATVKGATLRFNAEANFAKSSAPASQKMSVELTRDGRTAVTIWEVPGWTWFGTLNRGSVRIDLKDYVGSASTTICFRMTKLYFGGHWSIDDVVIAAAAKPPAPANLSASLDSQNRAQISWSAGIADLGQSYEVERSDDNGNTWNKVGAVTDGSRTYADQLATPDKSFRYRVRAYNDEGKSGYSNIASVKTPGTMIVGVDMNIRLYYTPDQARRSEFEGVIGYLSEFIYEVSNGGRRLRNVTFYTAGDPAADTVDVRWNLCTEEYCNPSAGLFSYRNQDQWRGPIKMWDTTNQQTRTPRDQQGIGLVFAHEFVHSYFGLGHVSANSIMGSGGSYHLANFNFSNVPCTGDMACKWEYANLSSQADAAPYAPVSEWDVIGLPSSQTDWPGRGDPASWWKQFSFYKPDLTTRMTPHGQTASVELNKPGGPAAARQELTIKWITSGGTVQAAASNLAQDNTSGLVRLFVIERAASTTSAAQLVRNKEAVKLAVARAEPGDTVGVIAFDSSATLVQPLITLDSQATRDAVKSAIDGITAGDSDVALGDALAAARAELSSTDALDATRALYLLGTGTSTTGATPQSALASYQTGDIRIISLDYGVVAAEAATLFGLAEDTYGQYYPVSLGLPALIGALNSANNRFYPTAAVDLVRGSGYVSTTLPLGITAHVDASLGRVGAEVIFYGTAGDITPALVDPANDATPLADCTTATDESGPLTICTAEVAVSSTGDWTLDVQSSVATHIDYRIVGMATDGQTTLQATVGLQQEYAVVYPAPIRVTATVGDDDLVTDLTVTGLLQAPDGSTTTFALHDAGNAPDLDAGDGLYVASLSPEVNGKYVVSVQFSNADGTGQLTNLAVVLDTEDGSEPPAPSKTPVGFNFTRRAARPVTITGAPILGPNGERGGDAGVVELSPDNVPVSGRVTSGDPTSVYVVTIPDGFTGPFVIRVLGLLDGMNPYVKATSQTQEWSREGGLLPDDDQISWQVTASAGETFIIEVSHVDVNATEGSYQISAGPPLSTDQDGLSQDELETIFEQLVPGGTGQNIFLPFILR